LCCGYFFFFGAAFFFAGAFFFALLLFVVAIVTSLSLFGSVVIAFHSLGPVPYRDLLLNPTSTARAYIPVF
jgi:hypothetical protein